jgi:hypothetical protein
MHRIWFFLLLLFFVPVSGSPESEGCQKEVEKIDAQVEKLNAEKRKHLDLAAKYQKEGDQWQYSTGRIEEGYKYWGMASDEQKKAINIQLQIDMLLERRQRIYQYYPELWQNAQQ